uniref:DDE-1 domain-containing protein n=2 Tax=Homalodisca TaxID=139475 RepID=A0A1B6JFL2_9HEMI
MPRTYIKKKTQKYDEDSLKEAVKEVDNGSSVYAAARKYNIPYETLRRWSENPPKTPGSGKATVLSKEEENYIVEALLYAAKCGYPLDRKDLQYMVCSYVKSVGRKTPFKDDMPGYDFLRGFEKRWAHELSKRKPEILTKARAEGLSQFVVDEFFKIYEQVLVENGLENHPERIFNLDETGLGTDPTKGKVFVPKSAKVSYSRSGGAGRLQYSVLFVASASGERYPPCVVFKGQGDLQSTWVQGGPPGALYGVTQSGWMQDFIFEKWLINFANQTKNLEKPVLVLFDGHGSHLTYNVTRVARDNDIILLCLPPNTSHALQPLDVGVFAPMKSAWREILKNWYRESRLKNVDKAVFPSLLSKLVSTSFKSEHIIGGFKGSGIYPVNKSVLEKRIVSVQPTRPMDLQSGAQPKQNSIETPKDIAEAPIGRPEPTGLKLANPVQDLPGPSSSVAGLPEISPSPMKKLREAILSTLSPEQSSSIKDALKNSKKKRRRVQGSCGEVMTTNEVMDRLKEEEDARKEKIKSKTNRPKPITALGKTIKQEPGLVQAKPQKKPRATKRF